MICVCCNKITKHGTPKHPYCKDCFYEVFNNDWGMFSQYLNMVHDKLSLKRFIYGYHIKKINQYYRVQPRLLTRLILGLNPFNHHVWDDFNDIWTAHKVLVQKQMG